MMQIDERTKKVAIALAKNDRHSETSTCPIGNGFEVPVWLLYVSEAADIIRASEALSGK